MRCAKHGEETEVSCGRCATPVCPRCMVHSDVGVRCNNCAGDRIGRPLGGSSKVVVAGALVIGLIVVIAIIGGAFGGNSTSTPDIGDLTDFTGETTVSQVEDPWTGGQTARDGYRFVAVEVIVENNGGQDEVPVFTDPQTFTLSDKERFVYAPVISGGAEPRLPSVQLDEGTKARGWITFEVPKNAEVVALHDYANSISLRN
jgi:hypothetical protein